MHSGSNLMDEIYWAALKTDPRRELTVQCQLRDLDFETYLPLLKTFKKYLGKGRRQIEPFFPGYLFARLSRCSDLFRLRQVRGLNYVVSFDGQPARVDPHLIEDFRRRENGKGYVCLRPPKDAYAPHQPLQIIDGPFIGYRGLFVRYLDGAQRVCLLLNVLSRQAGVELPVSAVTSCF
jgi:transcriptional antiterminator RfaH